MSRLEQFICTQKECGDVLWLGDPRKPEARLCWSCGKEGQFKNNPLWGYNGNIAL